MRGRFLVFCLGAGATLAFACTDELVEDVPPEVCISEKRWVGGKHGHPEMYPGRDCVGCHLENDGPPLAVGGTLYPYITGKPQIFDLQSGTDCFGIKDITVTITDADEQEFKLVTNEAGNFYIEGNPDDFAKPFSAQVDWTNDDGTPGKAAMNTGPLYGGCARCHDPSVPTAMTFELNPTDPEYRNGQARIGMPGYQDKQLQALGPAVAP